MQSTGHTGEALVAARAQLGDDDHVDAVVEDGAELRRAVADARVAVDAIDMSMRSGAVLPLRVALALARSTPFRLGSRQATGARRQHRRSRASSAATGSTPPERYATRVAADQQVPRAGPADTRRSSGRKYPFLSDEWIAEAKKIRDEARQPAHPPAHTVKMNQVITDVPVRRRHDQGPHGHRRRRARAWTSATSTTPDLTVTIDYATAKAIFVDGNPQAGMQAFMAGKIKVQGDMTKLMAMQQAPRRPRRRRGRRRQIKEITE